MGQVGWFVDVGDFGWGVEQGVGDLVGDYVGFVVIGYCYQYVGVVGVGLVQYCGE